MSHPIKSAFYEDVEWPTERVTHHLLKSNRAVILVSPLYLLKPSAAQLSLHILYSMSLSANSLQPARFRETLYFKGFQSGRKEGVDFFYSFFSQLYLIKQQFVVLGNPKHVKAGCKL